MATTETVEQSAEPIEDDAPRQLNVASLILLVGAVGAVSTMAFWWIGGLSAEPEPHVGREVFGNIPGVFVALFYVSVSVAIFLSAYFFAQRARNWARGAAEDRTRMLKQRLHNLREGLAMKTLLRDPAAGL
ncbi:hypothetical protein ACFLRH_03140, partial [Actinomycetota bacterium]